MDSAALGKISLVRTWWHGNGYHLRKAPASMTPRPTNLNWARFLGPLKWRDYDPQQYWNWRAYLDFVGGQVTDLFTHWIDVVHMFMGYDVPVAASASGGVYAYKDGRTAPIRLTSCWNIRQTIRRPSRPHWCRAFEARALNSADEREAVHRPRGLPLYAREWNARRVQGDRARDPLTFEHVKNFLDCVVSRNKPNGDVLIGHRSAQASHLGNIAYMQKRRLNLIRSVRKSSRCKRFFRLGRKKIMIAAPFCRSNKRRLITFTRVRIWSRYVAVASSSHCFNLLRPPAGRSGSFG